MPLHIRPISDLRNKSLEISKLAHKHGTVFITRNGKEDLVVMSVAMWEDLYVYPKLLAAEKAEKAGAKALDFDEVMDDLGKKYGLGKYWKGEANARRKRGSLRNT